MRCCGGGDTPKDEVSVRTGEREYGIPLKQGVQKLLLLRMLQMLHHDFEVTEAVSMPLTVYLRATVKEKH